MGSEKQANTMGTQSPDLYEKNTIEDGVVNKDSGREVDFMTRNGLNFQSFQRRKIQRISFAGES